MFNFILFCSVFFFFFSRFTQQCIKMEIHDANSFSLYKTSGQNINWLCKRERISKVKKKFEGCIYFSLVSRLAIFASSLSYGRVFCSFVFSSFFFSRACFASRCSFYYIKLSISIKCFAALLCVLRVHLIYVNYTVSKLV